MLAEILYIDDSSDHFSPNNDGGGAGQTPTDPSWVAGYLSLTSSKTDNTNIDFLVGQQYVSCGSLGPYTKNPGIYHCPADQSADSKYGPRVRSCSLNGYVGDGSGGIQSKVVVAGTEHYYKTADFKKLKPVDAVMFLDERQSVINDGWFWGPISSTYVEDLPALNHGNNSSFSFADGHVELHHWLDGRFMGLTAYGANLFNSVDVQWMWTHYTGQ